MKTTLPALTFCDQCGRTDDDIGQCGRSVTACAVPLPIDPTRIAVISYDSGSKTVAIPVDRLLRGKLGDFARVITVDDPTARLLYPEADARELDRLLNANAHEIANLTIERDSLRHQVGQLAETNKGYATETDELKAALKASEEARDSCSAQLASALERLDRGATGPGPAKPAKK